MIFSNTTFYIAKTHDESSKNDILLEFIEDIIGAKSISLYKILNSLLKKTIILKDSKCEFSYLYKKMQVNETEIDELFNSLEAFGLISIFKNTTNQNIIIHINEIPSFKTITSNIMLNSYIKSKLTNEKLEEYKTLLTPVYQNNGLFEDISCTVEQFLKAKEYHVSNIQDEVINTSLCSFFKLPINYNDELNNIIEKCKKEFSIEKIIELMKESANKFETFVEIDTKVLQEKINTARNIIIPLVSNTIYRDSFI
jgi:replication initiation and membrane attachment protein DnaB